VKFEKGYVVSSNGDTTRGLLKRSTYMELAQTVEFRASKDSTASYFYTTHDLKSFAFDEGDLFEAVTYADTANKNKTEFGHIVLEGYYNLYALARQTLSEYLVKSSDTAYLLYDDNVDVFDDFDKKVQLGNYRNMLAFLARDCNRSNTEFEKLQFSQHDIMHAVKQLNECHQSSSIVHRQKAKLDAHVVLYAGAFVLNNTWAQYSGGAELRLRNTKVSRKLAFVTGLHYSRIIEVEKGYFYNPYLISKRDRITEIYSVPATIHYTFLEHAIQPYVYLGMGAAYKTANYHSPYPDEGFQRRYGFSVIMGVGIEVYPIANLAIKADWRHELLLQYPNLGVALRF